MPKLLSFKCISFLLQCCADDKAGKFFLLLFSAMALVSQAEAATDHDEALRKEARQLVEHYQSTLKQQLQASIMTDGLDQAIRMCNLQAPVISHRIGADSGWQIKRVSHKNRNPNNKPDPWESSILANFQDKISRGAPLPNMEHGERVTINGKPAYRFMKAIGIKPVCLNCHGTRVSSQVNEVLKSFYPQDKATGYKPGDLRGAFSFYKVLESDSAIKTQSP